MHVEQLNRRLGDALGYVCAGTKPRFSWQWAPDLPYWRTRLGGVWVLCQWIRPLMSPEQWAREFDGRYPYPAEGMFHPHTETALSPGNVPDERLTQNYIRVIDLQMSTTFAEQLIAVEDDLARDKERNELEWVEYVQDQNPAFSNPSPGSRGGHVSFGGFE